jgi:hypothetical protein
VWAVQRLEHPIVTAVSHGHLAICTLFVSQKQIAVQYLHDAMFQAASRCPGDAAILQVLYTVQPSVSKPRLSDHNVLCEAAQHGNLEMVRFLLDRGADANNRLGSLWSGRYTVPVGTSVRGDADTCPMVSAACGGNPAVMQLLVDRGATLEDCWHEALTCAAARGHEAAVQWLLTDAVLILGESPWHLRTQLHFASWRLDSAVFSTWQEQGAWVWARYCSPLDVAAIYGCVNVVQLLLECGHNCGYKGGALAHASYHGHLSVVRLLIQHGADVNLERAIGSFGLKFKYPLRNAIEQGHLEVVKLLLQAGAVADEKPLVLAAAAGRVGIIQHFLDLGSRDTEDKALVEAAVSGWLPFDSVDLLLTAGQGDAELGNAGGSSLVSRLEVALTAAVAAGSLKMVKHLLSKNPLCAPSSAVTGGPAGAVFSQECLNDALCAAASGEGRFVHPRYGWSINLEGASDCPELLELLIRHGADVNARDGAALRAARDANKAETVNLLLKHGAVDKDTGSEAVVGEIAKCTVSSPA